MPRADLSAPIVVETAPVRCPPVDPRLKAEFSKAALGKAVARPGPRECPKDGKLAVCESDTRAWIDGLEASVTAKHKAGNTLIKDIESCRGAPRRSPKTS